MAPLPAAGPVWTPSARPTSAVGSSSGQDVPGAPPPRGRPAPAAGQPGLSADVGGLDGCPGGPVDGCGRRGDPGLCHHRFELRRRDDRPGGLRAAGPLRALRRVDLRHARPPQGGPVVLDGTLGLRTRPRRTVAVLARPALAALPGGRGAVCFLRSEQPGALGDRAEAARARDAAGGERADHPVVHRRLHGGPGACRPGHRCLGVHGRLRRGRRALRGGHVWACAAAGHSPGGGTPPHGVGRGVGRAPLPVHQEATC